MVETLTEQEMKEKIARCKEIANQSLTKYMVLAIVGAVIFTLAIVFIVIGGIYASKDDSPLKNLGIAFVIIGPFLLIGPGLGMMTPGIALWITTGVRINVAKKTIKKYQIKLDIANEEEK